MARREEGGGRWSHFLESAGRRCGAVGPSPLPALLCVNTIKIVIKPTKSQHVFSVRERERERERLKEIVLPLFIFSVVKIPMF